MVGLLPSSFLAEMAMVRSNMVRNPLCGFASTEEPPVCCRNCVSEGRVNNSNQWGPMRKWARQPRGQARQVTDAGCWGAPCSPSLMEWSVCLQLSRIILLTYIPGKCSSWTAFPGGGFYLGFQFSLDNVLSFTAKQKHILEKTESFIQQIVPEPFPWGRCHSEDWGHDRVVPKPCYQGEHPPQMHSTWWRGRNPLIQKGVDACCVQKNSNERGGTFWGSMKKSTDFLKKDQF